MAETHAKPKQDRFAAWVRQYGVSRLMRDLGKTSRSSIHSWFGKNRHWPEVDTAAVLIFLSEQEPLKEDGRPLTWDDIFGDLAAVSIKHYLNDECRPRKTTPSSRVDVVMAGAS